MIPNNENQMFLHKQARSYCLSRNIQFSLYWIMPTPIKLESDTHDLSSIERLTHRKCTSAYGKLILKTCC